jgi:hypothetical protein
MIMVKKVKRIGLSMVCFAWAVTAAHATGFLYRDGLVLQLDAGKIFNVSDGAVLTRWIDASGNNHDAVGGVSPTYLADGGGGYPAVRFNGIDDYLVTDLLTGTNASIFIVYANRRDPLLVQHSDTLVSSLSAGGGIDLSASRTVDGEHLVQFGWDKNSLFNADYQAQIGADEIIQWNAVDSMDGGTWYNGGSLPDFDDADTGASLTSPSYGVVMTSRAISSTASDHTNTVVSSDGKRLGLGPAGGGDIYFRQNEASTWTFDFDRDVSLRQIMFDAMGNVDDRVRVTIEGGAEYALDRDDCAETSTWSGDTSMEVYTFPVPVFLPAGTDVTIAATASSNPVNNTWQLAGVIVSVPDPAPDYPGFLAEQAAGVHVESWVNGRSTVDAGTDIFGDRYYIANTVYHAVSGAPMLTIGAQSNGLLHGRNDIREILVYDHVLDEPDRLSVLSCLGKKYGIDVVDRPLDHPLEEYSHILGAQQIGRQYHFGESDVQVLNAARALYRQGSRVFKMAISEKYAYQNGVQDDPSIGSLTEVVRDEPDIRAVLDMPFTDILFWASTFAVPSWGKVATSNGLDSVTEQLIYDEIYDFTVHLRTNYNGSGKSFYIGNWEGDWLLAGSGSQDPENDITLAKINGMIDWATVRQQAIDDGKAATPGSDVKVWYYLEMNRGDWAVDGRPCAVNSVIPNLTKLDFISFSSWSIKNFNESDTHAVLDVIQDALPTNAPPPGPRLIIGEYGFAQQTMTQQEQVDLYIDKIQHYLNWSGGPPRFILMWEFFWNELGGSGNWKNMHQITEDNERHLLYYLHENYFRDMRRWVETYYEVHGAVPSGAAYAAEAASLLNRISLSEYVPYLGPTESRVIQFGGSVGSYSNANWQSQIGADEIIQWNGVNSWGGSFGANGTVGGSNPGQPVGATLWSSNSVLTLTSRMISSSEPVGTNTVSSGDPNVLGITGGDNAKFNHQYDEEWTFDFNTNMVLRQLILVAMDGDAETVDVIVEGIYTNTFTRLDSQISPVTWEPAANRFVYTFPGGGLSIPQGTDIKLGATSAGVWGLQGVVVEMPGTSLAYDYDAWAMEWGVDIGSGGNDYDGDGLKNLVEFALGGDPTDPLDTGRSVKHGIGNDGSMNFITYVHAQRADPRSGLNYYCETAERLDPADWADSGYTVSGTNVTGGTLNYVTNIMEAVEDTGFIRLNIEML